MNILHRWNNYRENCSMNILHRWNTDALGAVPYQIWYFDYSVPDPTLEEFSCIFLNPDPD